jgi:hypothetical protein
MASPHARPAHPLLWMLLALMAPAVRADTPGPAAGVAPATRVEVTAPRPAAPRVVRSAEAQALLAVREEGQRQVQALVDQMKALPAGSLQLRALQRQAVETKKQNEVEFLRTKVTFARQRGDLAAVHALEDQIDQFLNPRPRVVAPADKPEGGAR